MKMQCGRCLSSMFPKVFGGCSFCAGKDVRHVLFTYQKPSSISGRLNAHTVIIREPKK